MRFTSYEDREHIHGGTVSGERIHPLRPAPPTESPVTSLIELSGQVTTVNGHEVSLLGGRRKARLADTGNPGVRPPKSRWATVEVPSAVSPTGPPPCRPVPEPAGVSRRWSAPDVRGGAGGRLPRWRWSSA